MCQLFLFWPWRSSPFGGEEGGVSQEYISLTDNDRGLLQVLHTSCSRQDGFALLGLRARHKLTDRRVSEGERDKIQSRRKSSQLNKSSQSKSLDSTHDLLFESYPSRPDDSDDIFHMQLLLIISFIPFMCLHLNLSHSFT